MRFIRAQNISFTQAVTELLDAPRGTLAERTTDPSEHFMVSSDLKRPWFPQKQLTFSGIFSNDWRVIEP